MISCPRSSSDVCGAVLLIAIVVVITLQIFARSVLGEAFIWPEELAVFLSIYLVFMGAAYNARRDTHIKVSFFANRMPRLMRFGITLTTHLLVLGHLGVLLWSMVPLSEALSISRSPASLRATTLTMSASIAAVSADRLSGLAYSRSMSS